jgi:hypothetical protein
MDQGQEPAETMLGQLGVQQALAQDGLDRASE